LRVDHVAPAVHRDDRADDQVPRPEARRAQPRLHPARRACGPAGGGTRADADVALGHIDAGVPARLHAHGLSGAHIRGAHVEVEYHCPRDDRHSGHAGVEADPLCLEVLLNTCRPVQAEGASPAEVEGLRAGHGGRGSEAVRLAGSGRAATNVDSGRGTGFAEDDGASLGRRGVLGVADENARHIGDGVSRSWLHEGKAKARERPCQHSGGQARADQERRGRQRAPRAPKNAEGRGRPVGSIRVALCGRDAPNISRIRRQDRRQDRPARGRRQPRVPSGSGLRTAMNDPTRCL